MEKIKMALARATAMHAIRCYDRMRDEIEEAIAALSELEGSHWGSL